MSRLLSQRARESLLAAVAAEWCEVERENARGQAASSRQGDLSTRACHSLSLPPWDKTRWEKPVFEPDLDLCAACAEPALRVCDCLASKVRGSRTPGFHSAPPA